MDGWIWDPSWYVICLKNFRRLSLFWLLLFVGCFSVAFSASDSFRGVFTNMKSCQYSNLFGSNGCRLPSRCFHCWQKHNARISKLCFFDFSRSKFVATRKISETFVFPTVWLDQIVNTETLSVSALVRTLAWLIWPYFKTNKRQQADISRDDGIERVLHQKKYDMTNQTCYERDFSFHFRICGRVSTYVRTNIRAMLRYANKYIYIASNLIEFLFCFRY